MAIYLNPENTDSSPPPVSHGRVLARGMLWGLALASLFWISLELVSAYSGG